MTDHVLGTLYRLNLLDMRKEPGGLIEDHSVVSGSDFGFNFTHESLYLSSLPVDPGPEQVTTGILPVIMPANYIAGSAFTFRVGIATNSGNDPQTGSTIDVGIKRIAEDQYDDGAIAVFSETKDWTVGDYTEYDFNVTAEDAAAVGPGDFLNIRISIEFFSLVTNGSDWIYFTSAFLDLNPS